jgi:hypothetical protein
MEIQINVLAVLTATVTAFIIGGIWYSPMLFGRPWQSLAGLSDEDVRSGQGRIFGGAFVLMLIAALVLAPFIGPDAPAVFGAAAGFAVGLGWVATALGVVYLFSRQPLRLWLIDAGYQVVSFTAMGAVIGAWP